jgi:hypothetical protein
MTFKQKKSYKKLAKTLNILAYVMVALFFLNLVLLFTGVLTSKTINPIPAMIIFISPIMLGVIIAGIGQGYGLKRMEYKAKIRMYREYRHFNFALDCIQAGEFEKAIDIYNGMPVGYLREFIYSHLLAYFSLGKHTEGNKEQAIDRIAKLRETYCQHNVKF